MMSLAIQDITMRFEIGLMAVDYLRSGWQAGPLQVAGDGQHGSPRRLPPAARAAAECLKSGRPRRHPRSRTAARGYDDAQSRSWRSGWPTDHGRIRTPSSARDRAEDGREARAAA